MHLKAGLTMGKDTGKLSQLPPVARTETKYLDMQGNPTTPETAVRIITSEFDADGTLLNTSVQFDPSKADRRW